ncbi:hypothetical protein HNP38_001918 [Chryseobacterium defluvii]|uniref:D-alanyl-lipoteichoic acid biosynthesis protein DltD n=1 Tax=Chryseobacterium defluvii TaxID=160396 RepID=A0A840KI98_9FLAO|nr:hypothetical protein [Chryseobacterium defluvii]MBB4806622.1 hypothetical protein [Chryseobacterium defluvii]
MKKSLLRLTAFSILPLLFIGYAIYITGEKSDDFYKRFTSPQQNSLILGSSRAASMNPEIMDNIIHKKYPNADLYDYAFTWAHSPYGPKYLESIEKKTDPDTKDGVFIVTVEPTALMVDKTQPDEAEYYVENDKSVAQTSLVAINPNIEYLLENYNFSITNEINKKIRPPKNVIAEVEILDNGKVNGKIIKRNSPEKQARINAGKMKELEYRVQGLKISENRLAYLSRTIEFLKNHGKVFMVRMPVNKVPYAIENKYYPDFDKRMIEIAAKEGVHYVNYNDTSNNYQWTDEVHLEPESMNRFSAVVAQDILSLN